MYTVTYYPTDYFNHFEFDPGDHSYKRNNHAWNEPPSFCVRLWVFEMPDD